MASGRPRKVRRHRQAPFDAPSSNKFNGVPDLLMTHRSRQLRTATYDAQYPSATFDLRVKSLRGVSHGRGHEATVDQDYLAVVATQKRCDDMVATLGWFALQVKGNVSEDTRTRARRCGAA